MIVNNNIFVMRLVEKFFKTFTKKEICDTTKDTEMIIALSTESREKVDEMILNVIEAGGKETREPQDHGWMYGRSFQDINGHLWEIIYMDEKPLKKRSVKKKPSLVSIRKIIQIDICKLCSFSTISNAAHQSFRNIYNEGKELIDLLSNFIFILFVILVPSLLLESSNNISKAVSSIYM
jgi:predicted lactoylglutathione lyase